MMSDQVSVPLLAASGGSVGYLTFSPNGERLFMAWEDMLWSLDGQSFRVVHELHLPAPVDGMVQSVDGRELYLLPATAGDLTAEERGMFTVDATTLELVSYAEDWPRLMNPFFFAAPAAAAVLKAPEETSTPTGCSGREEGPPCGPGVEIGEPYSYTLYTHCGIRGAYFDGRPWIADPILSVDDVNPPPGWGNPLDRGSMELVAEDLARFTSTRGLAAEFRPLPEGSEYPWKPCD